MEAFRKHIKALGGNIRVDTDVLTIETETYPFTTERKYNVELTRQTLNTFASPFEGGSQIPITTPGGWVQARSVVVAVGYWHNEFMKKHFVTEDCPSPDFVGVASQTAIYTLPTPLPPTPASIFSYSPGAVLQEVAPARFQVAYASNPNPNPNPSPSPDPDPDPDPDPNRHAPAATLGRVPPGHRRRHRRPRLLPLLRWPNLSPSPSPTPSPYPNLTLTLP